MGGLGKGTLLAAILLGGLAVVRAETAGRVLSVQGTVEVRQPNWVPATVNQLLEESAFIRTADRSRAVLLLLDETQLKLNANTQLQLRSVARPSSLGGRLAQVGGAAATTILQTRQGEVWLRSKRTPTAVQVTTPAVTAAIRGTELNLSVALDGTTLATVVEGIVDLHNDLGRVSIRAGEQGQCRVGEAPSKTLLMNPEDAVQWTYFYSAAVSPRDFPFVYASREQARLVLLSENPSEPVRRAQLLHDAGELEPALAVLQNVESPEAEEVRGTILLEQNRLDEASQAFQRASLDSDRTRLGLAFIHYRLNDLESAFALLEDPGSSPFLQIGRGMMDLVAGSVETAQTVLESVAPGSPVYSLAQGFLSSLFLTLNNKPEALAAAMKAIEANPESPSAYLYLSLVQQSQFDLPGAVQSAEKALSLDPSFIQARIQYARLLFGQGHSSRAERIIREAQALAPEEAGIYSTLGFILLGQAKTDQAGLEFERSIGLDDSRGEPHLGLGIVHMRVGRTAEAISGMLAAATLEPQISLYQSYLGKAFYEDRQFQQAFAALETARGLDAQDPTPYLYQGIFENDLNLPGLAVRNFEAAIRLNDNRAVYRSRLLLDEDLATRSFNLAFTYNRMGLSDWAKLQAVKSTLADPANGSTHLFLYGAFSRLTGRLAAAGSELLMARMLLPANAGSFDSFNDYTTLFEGSRLDGTVQGALSSSRGRDGAVLLSGGTDRLAFVSFVSHAKGDGWRPINDDDSRFETANTFKFELAPRTELLVSHFESDSAGGDLQLFSPVVSESNNPHIRTRFSQRQLEAGVHHQLRPGSDLLFHISARRLRFALTDTLAPGEASFRGIDRFDSLSWQLSHLLRFSRVQIQYGADVLDGDNFAHRLLTRISHTQFRTLYGKADFFLQPELVLTAGLDYDWSNDNGFLDNLLGMDSDRPSSAWNPQFALFYGMTPATTFRAAVLRITQTFSESRLAPSHLVGFTLNRNEFPLTRSNAFHFAWNQRLGQGSFLDSSVFYRDTRLPSGHPDIEPFQGNLYGGRVALNQFITSRLTVVPEISIQDSTDLGGVHRDRLLNVSFYYNHSKGVFWSIKASRLQQRGEVNDLLADPFVSRFNVFLADVDLSYEIPGKRGSLFLRIANLFDRRYSFIVDPLAFDPRVPARQFRLGMSFNF